ncbi:hypothetical protein AVEN_116639-1 [Araneus ventricosus]|uniref:Uncharacterized protein n=1 Tax=Araneus ventricosus TaxID=182803 RepID=A0A4Y2NTN0_ARAVE|nr:hypothetical protein AVEN_116639-1 [Araneus ventricosus]
MPRYCDRTLRGIMKCHASPITTALIVVKELETFDVGTKGPCSEKKITSSPIQLVGRRQTEGMMFKTFLPEFAIVPNILPLPKHAVLNSKNILFQ